jgi:glutathione S-transferase
MQLYFSPGACSLSPHIALREAGIAFDLVRVSFATKTTSRGDDFRKVNDKGMVPTLVLDDGRVLTEGPAIVQYIADLAPASALAPPPGTFERVRLQEWLNFISTELHKTYSPLFNRKMPDEAKELFRAQLADRLDFVSHQLERAPFLTGETFTVADAYLFTVLQWSRLVAVDLAKWPALVSFLERVRARPSVTAAIAAEKSTK